MKNDIITLYDENNNPKEYKLLMVIDKEYKYIIYTDINNYNIKQYIHAVKIKDYNDKETITLTDNEITMIEKHYQEIVNN